MKKSRSKFLKIVDEKHDIIFIGLISASLLCGLKVVMIAYIIGMHAGIVFQYNTSKRL
jgi:hypothetical protein